jgi:lipoate-protein ligase A
MVCIETGSNNPAINLAFEEYFLKGNDLGKNVFMLWQSEPAIVIGRFQNLWEETNFRFAEENNIPIVRRISGGGAVYQDAGNLCFSFILQNVTPDRFNKITYIQPVVHALEKLGIHSDVTSRNDLFIDGKKFSGNAMAYHHNRLLFHGTLLFDTDLEQLEKALTKPEFQIDSKGVKSVRSKVTNITQYVSSDMEVSQFKQKLTLLIMEKESADYYLPTQKDLDAIQKLSINKYQSWDWNYGNSPPSTLKNSMEIDDRQLTIFLELESGRIKTCRIDGDYFKHGDGENLERRILNIRFQYDEVLTILKASLQTEYLGATTLNDLAKFIMGMPA